MKYEYTLWPIYADINCVLFPEHKLCMGIIYFFIQLPINAPIVRRATATFLTKIIFLFFSKIVWEILLLSLHRFKFDWTTFCFNSILFPIDWRKWFFFFWITCDLSFSSNGTINSGLSQMLLDQQTFVSKRTQTNELKQMKSILNILCKAYSYQTRNYAIFIHNYFEAFIVIHCIHCINK